MHQVENLQSQKSCQPELVEGGLYIKMTGFDRLKLTTFQTDAFPGFKQQLLTEQVTYLYQ